MFKHDSIAMRLADKLFDVVILNFLFVLFSLPVLTSGFAATALYTVIFRRGKDENVSIVKTFFCSIKENIKQCTLFSLLLFVIAVIGFGAGTAVEKLFGVSQTIILYFMLSLVLLLFSVSGWIFPLVARFRQDTTLTLRNAVSLSIVHIPVTALLLLIKLLPYILISMLPNLGIDFAIFFFLSAGPVLQAAACSKLLLRVFARYKNCESE